MRKQLTIAFVVAAFLSPISYASIVDISWSNADKYRDLKSVTETKAKIQKRFFKEIHAHLNELGTSLPHKFTLSIDVTQVDLAGRIDMVNGQQIRIVRDMYYPNMILTYRLKDAEGKVIQSQESKLKGRNFLRQANRLDDDAFKHEKYMITDWFEKEFATVINK
ncbi:DUF3016 domain-containing protein [Thalassotalea euphylliae]|uniref:DUF3016 domain-containing protein n=1 Tax=Thalassotalea euphylliae TaxID=1655234 RepID=UPI00363C3783